MTTTVAEARTMNLHNDVHILFVSLHSRHHHVVLKMKENLYRFCVSSFETCEFSRLKYGRLSLLKFP